MAAAEAPRIRGDEKVALVLGAGGARGLAQIGVIEALQAREMNIVALAGASSGALVGGLHAAGKLGEYRDWLCSLDRTQMLRLLDPGWGRPALFEGTRLVGALREIAGSPRIEDLPVDFTAVAVDLMRQREVWLRQGDLWDAAHQLGRVERKLHAGDLRLHGVERARHQLGEAVARRVDLVAVRLAAAQSPLDPVEQARVGG